MKKKMSQASLDNLKKGTPWTTERAKRYARYGQKKSVETKKRNKAMAEFAKIVADTEITNEDMLRMLADLGISDPSVQNNALIAAGLFRKAIRGSIPAINKWEEWMDLAESGDEAALRRMDILNGRVPSAALANYLKKIDSSYGVISASAVKHLYTHYQVSGGRGSGKSSWASMTVVCLLMDHPDVHALVLRKVGSTLRDSVYNQYLWAIETLGISNYWTAKKSPPELIYTPTRQKILFRGADDPAKLKGLKTDFGYIGITHFEEADQFSGRAEIENILQSTMRGGREFWNLETFNAPRSRDHWINRDSQLERTDRIRHHSTYLDLDDPDWLGPAFLEEAQSLKKCDEGRYKHEYLGIAIGRGGNVFQSLELREITDEEVRHFDSVCQGVNWGWFPEPFVFIRLHYDRARQTVYLLDELVGTRLTNQQTAAWITDHAYDDKPIICDYIEPQSISDYRSAGLTARAVSKRKDSPEYAMKWLQCRTIVIDRVRTPHAYEEFTGYEYEKDSRGEWISSYPDRNNRIITAVRFALDRVMSRA